VPEPFGLIPSCEPQEKKMKWRIPAAALLLAVALIASFLACSYVSMRTKPYIGVPRYSPTDPAKIAILHERPQQPAESLGEVIVDASTDPPPSVGEIEAKLREGGAQMGADALVLVYDRNQIVGTWVSGWWGGASAYPVTERIVVAVAVKYK
jgi:hypothetical protein